MESPILKQIAKFLQDKKKYKRWLAVFVCLAVVVGFATTAALKMRGKAMTHDERVLNCKLQVHQHAETCYDQEKNIICGYADYVVHKHNDDCYDPHNGNLVCALPEVEAHQHTDECYQEQQALACGLEESEGHQHTEECRAKEQGELTCQAEEHTHTEECQAEDGAFSCGKEEHTHADECYQWTETLTCGQEESEGHHHTEACNQVQKTLVCQRPEIEVHTHGDECYQRVLITPEGEEIVQDPKDNTGVAQEVLAGTANKEVPEGRIEVRRSCGKLQAEEHTHTQENGCIEIREVLDGSDLRPVEETAEGDGNTENEDLETVQTNWDGIEKSDLGEADEEEDITKTFEGDGFAVIATYKKDANIPDKAEFLVEQITPESDEGHYAERSKEFQEMAGNESATMQALLKVGFYVDGEEIEPESPVKLTVQFLGEDGLPEGSPITIVHFAEDGNEKLDGSDVEDGSTTFEMSSFSEIAIGSDPEKYENDDSVIPVFKSCEYKGEMINAVFTVEGRVTIPSDAANDEEKAVDAESDKSLESDAAKGKTAENKEKSKTVDKEKIANDIEFATELLKGNAQEYEVASAVCKEEAEEVYLNRVLSYYMSYNGERLDLSDCTVTVDITPTQKLLNYVKKNVDTEQEGDTETKLEAMLSLVQLNSESIETEGQKSKEEVDMADMSMGNNSDSNGMAETENTESSDNTEDELVEDAESSDGNAKNESEETAESSDGNAENESEETADDEISGVDSEEQGTDTKPSVDNASQKGEILASAPIAETMMNKPITATFEASGTQNAIAAAVTSQANPEFTVEFYAGIDKLVTVSKMGPTTDEELADKVLSVIDTDGRTLPFQNGSIDINRKVITLNENNYVQTKNEMIEVYTPEKYDYVSAPGLAYFNKIAQNDNYKLVNIRVQRKGSNTWEEYPCETKEWHFTNKEATKNEYPDKFILVTNGAIIRLEHMVQEKTVRNGTSFYDYDVSNGKIYNAQNAIPQNEVNRGNSRTPAGAGNATWYMFTGKQGINSNFADQTFGFGNSENLMKTGLGDFEGNKANDKNKGYGSATFGMVTGLSDGKIQYKAGVKAPNLFNDGSANGKTSYSGNLVFSQKGDTYTLTGSEVMEGDKVVSSQNGLDRFVTRTNWNKTRFLLSNDFYPLDGVSSAGTDGHDLMFGEKSTKDKLKAFSSSDASKVLPSPGSDDDQDHNHYFGMHFTIRFNLVEDYVGPLEYLFYGYDDMFVFLDGPCISGKLVCDIGGVHSSIGEYVNLKNYVTETDPITGQEKVKAGKYELTFFYTERGASGSSCWMQFTLPSVSFATTDRDTGKLQIQKKVTDAATSEEDEQSEEEFGFKINFTTKDETGKEVPLMDDYSYTKYKAGTNTVVENDVLIWNDAKFTLKADEYIIIDFLPNNSKYVIEEVGPVDIIEKGPGGVLEWKEKGDNPYVPEINGGTPTGPGKIEGTITKNKTVEITYNNVKIYNLPETGGEGTVLYTMAGVVAILLGAGFMYRKKFREGRVGGSS